MKQILIFTIFGFAACDVYLPPRRTISSSATGQSRPFSIYGPPSSQYSGPTGQFSSALPQQIPILRLDTNNNGDGTYNYAYETANGISVQEQGDARGDGTKALGAFSYTSPNGQPVQIQYTADENGFFPQGSHLPKSLVGPLRKSIEQNLAEERRGIVDNGQYRSGQNQGYGQQLPSVTQQYLPASQKWNGNTQTQKFSTSQKYSPPTRYNTPQRFNSAQQYRGPQSSSNTYLPPGLSNAPWFN